MPKWAAIKDKPNFLHNAIVQKNVSYLSPIGIAKKAAPRPLVQKDIDDMAKDMSKRVIKDAESTETCQGHTMRINCGKKGCIYPKAVY